MLMFRTSLFLLLFYCGTQTLGINIQTIPDVNGDGIIEVELQKTVTLVCGLNGDTPSDEELVWLRNGAVVDLKDGNKKGRSSVCINPVIYEDNGATFACHLHANTSDKASVSLNVTYHPQLSGSEEVTVEIDSPLVLQCDMRANPPVSSMTWSLNGSIVVLLEGGFAVTNDGFKSQLQVNKVDKLLHEATYQCTSDSPKYGQHSKTFYVTVTEKTIKFPLMPMIAGLVVVGLTAILAVASRWKKITKCCK
ncbi:transmembrane and immunoglobulin domain-containing protein 1 [Melanotaenia boesemani]|uniref:transmembrane and immunoglobulin domain-containing protein 1 n=1 Tax=Melanotaenia boesemani TaxID=1250792 RepID=UPI001C04D59A|nr:transmembrane and immunoglobulin domain-containing protein 1 [Melanotaenia boesemani]XP_041864460.1 transmembrane and immunoglobulin domain-containing protein 1 [Melanotaenia boesemani]